MKKLLRYTKTTSIPKLMFSIKKLNKPVMAQSLFWIAAKKATDYVKYESAAWPAAQFIMATHEDETWIIHELQ